MNVLILGAGRGSWDIRGRQLGAALGARVTSTPVEADFAWADLIVLVKRAITLFGDRARRSGRPLVWDALDFWWQPAENGVAPAEALALARRTAGQGVTVIGATQAMATALGGHYVPHHAWPGLAPAPARAEVRTVAYQGGAVYLGRWATWIADACAARGWQFVVNPQDLREADILVAFRDGPWDGWICREWKSGVKVVNAIAAGRPLISQDSAALRELNPIGCGIESRDDLDSALDFCATPMVRAAALTVGAHRAESLTVTAVAALYRQVLEVDACPA